MIKSLDTKENWYAVYTKSRTEKKVYERIIKAGFNAFLPLITTLRQWSDRKKKVKLPLIKSYVFVNTHQNKLNTVLEVSGVIDVLRHLGKPAVVKDIEIKNLKILIGNNDSILPISPIDLTKGEDIEVTGGPFTGLIAKYVSHSRKRRVIVGIEALQSYIEVTLPLNTIKKISS